MYCSVQNLKPYVHDTNAREIACGQAPTNICHVIISGSLVRDAEIKNNTRNAPLPYGGHFIVVMFTSLRGISNSFPQFPGCSCGIRY